SNDQKQSNKSNLEVLFNEFVNPSNDNDDSVDSFHNDKVQQVADQIYNRLTNHNQTHQNNSDVIERLKRELRNKQYDVLEIDNHKLPYATKSNANANTFAALFIEEPIHHFSDLASDGN